MNLFNDCIKGSNRLIDLRELHLDMQAFDFSNIFLVPEDQKYYGKYGDNKEPIPDLVNLKIISFHSGTSGWPDDLNPNWIQLFKDHYLFSLVRKRISCVSLNENFLPIIEITLNTV